MALVLVKGVAVIKNKYTHIWYMYIYVERRFFFFFFNKKFPIELELIGKHLEKYVSTFKGADYNGYYKT